MFTKMYTKAEWKNTLKAQNLDSFDSIWNYEKNANVQPDWVEEPNQRRGGWSGVCRIVLLDPQGQKKIVYLKRQSKHTYRSILSPFKGRLTFRREFRNIMRFMKRHLPTVTPVYYAHQGDDAILMTEELIGYRSLNDWAKEWQQQGMPSLPLYYRIIEEIGRVVSQMHHYHYRHSCLEFKHIFLSLNDDMVKVCLIDLEKLRYWPFSRPCQCMDLGRLYRRNAREMKLSDRWRFMKAYCGKGASKESIKSLWHAIEKQSLKKKKVP